MTAMMTIAGRLSAQSPTVITWNQSYFEVETPILISGDEGQPESSSTLQSEINQSISSCGATWLTLDSIESGSTSELWGLCFSATNNTGTLNRQANLARGITIIQQAPPGYSNPRIEPPTSFIRSPGTKTSFIVSNLMSNTHVDVMRRPVGGLQYDEKVCDLDLTAPRCTCSVLLPDGDYRLDTLGLTFTVRYPDPFYYEYVVQNPSYPFALSGNGQVRRVYVSGYYDGGTYHGFSSSSDLADLQSSVGAVSGDIGSWPSEWALSAGYDSSLGAYIEVSCPPNLTGGTLAGNTLLKVRSGNGTLRFSQPPVSHLLSVPVQLSNGFVQLSSTQYGVSYTVTDKEHTVSETGTGSSLALDASTMVGAWTVTASYGSHALLLYTFIPEDDIPVAEGPYESSAFNRIHSKTLGDGNDYDYFTDITVYDGLGYAKQEVALDANSRGELIRPIRYDFLRREERTYLPFADALPGYYISPAVNAQMTYWRQKGYGSNEGLMAYSTVKRENSNRGWTLSESLPGVGYHDAERSTQYAYRTNDAEEVVRLIIDMQNGAMTVGAYDAGSLCATEKTDGDGRMVTVWTDMEGRLVSEIRETETNGLSVRIETLYGYDRCGRLRWVVSPNGSVLLSRGSTYAIDSQLATRHCYVYLYDNRGRLVEKRLPGADPYRYVYDKGDRVVLFQDGNMRASSPQKWHAYYYDAAGRLARESLQSGGSYTQAQLQSGFDSSNTHSVYTSSVGSSTLRRYAYDSYPSWMPSSLAYVAASGYEARDSSRTKGLLCCEELKILGRNGSVYRSYYYNARGDLIQQVETTPDGKILRTHTRCDRQGRQLASRTEYGTGNTVQYVVSNAYTYDRRGRLTHESTSLSPDGPTSDVSYTYDDLGRPCCKTMGSGPGAVRDSLSYTLQGWLSGQEDRRGNTRLFGSLLEYEEDTACSLGNWTGDISAWTWQQSGQPERTYGFTYDGLHRLTDTFQSEGTYPMGDYQETIRYDRNGNITSLQQDNGGTSSTRTWTYIGNRRNAYLYDANGNIYCPGNDPEDEDVIKVTYNILNLPEQVLWYDDVFIDYTYLPDGTKLSALDYDEEGYRYAGPFRFRSTYEETFLESVAAAGGRIVRQEHQNSPATYEPRYFITDHLGSTRVVVDSLGTIVQQVDYLPYGEKCRNSTLISGENDYLYGGKEFQAPVFNIPWYDSQARFQTTDGMFVSLDPQCEKYYSLSPYAYCAGNPVRLVDRDGGDWRDVVNGFSSAVRKNLSPVGSPEPISPAVSNAAHYAIGHYLGNAATIVLGAQMMVDGAAMIAGGAGATAGGVAAAPATAGASVAVSAAGTGAAVAGATMSVTGAAMFMKGVKGAADDIYDNGQKDSSPHRSSTSGENNYAKRGRDEHKNYNPGDSYKTEYQLPSGKRADAVDETNGIVRELKPNNPKAIKRGEKQIQGYKNELEKLFPEKQWRSYVDTYNR